ncbi:3'-5' exonuclease domain containing protein [Plasmodium gonderi]|uniref:3'-5' exonuclease domain containing protein n=1 Tax=Plasmodium gonderi TaxID=77519 RepID=A0A1Y1JHV1_PLAGO|nr:3'-5' exonuclease domain containing protein [Plasmodium gonderi]GAW79664.1 3'-5' exonuclease domain containing protein [Plasmodium gonderi]
MFLYYSNKCMVKKSVPFSSCIANICVSRKIESEDAIKRLKTYYNSKFISTTSEEHKTVNGHVDTNQSSITLKGHKEKTSYKDIKIIENEKDGEDAAEEINQNGIIAVDFEGTNLGKYGKVCTMQVYTEKGNKEEMDHDKTFEKFYIFDMLKISVIKSVKKIIENKKTLKLVHDCREDSSALYNQLGIKFENVYDTSRAHMLLMEKKKNTDIYQVSFFQLLNDYLGIKDECLRSIKKEMYKNEKIWEIRPLSKMSIIYALKNVKYLFPLYRIFDNMLPTKKVLEKSKDFINYCFMNSRYKLPVDLAKRGNIVEAMLVSKSMLNCVFKLNSTRRGIACTPSSVAQFRDVKVGDVVLCVVSNKSIDQKILYLCKHDDVYDYWNLKERPRGKFKPSIHESVTDPMIQFCDEEGST